MLIIDILLERMEFEKGDIKVIDGLNSEKENEFAGFDSDKVLAKINTKAAELGYN